MRVGISTASFFGRRTVEDAIPLIGSLGAGLCEVFLSSISEFGERFGALLDARARDAGVEVYSVHGMSTMYEPQLFSRAKRQREDAFSLLDAALDCGARAGAGRSVFHGAPNYKGRAGEPDYGFLAEAIAAVDAHCRERGLILTWENVFWCQYRFPEFLPRLWEAGAPQTLGATLDVKQALRSGHDAMAYARAMGSRLYNLHLSDWEPGGRIVLPGRGQAPIAGWFHGLGELGYGGPAIVEVYQDSFGGEEELRECVAYLNGLR